MKRPGQALTITRREVLAGMALLASGFRSSQAAWASNDAPPMSADAALARLKSGNDAFVHQMTTTRAQTIAQRVALGTGQHPFAAILSCADSRTTPEILFNQGLGDLFVVRVAGNVVTVSERGSIEYAAAVLKSPLIVVMGHTACGAVAAGIGLARGEKFPGDIEEIAELIEPAAKATRDQPGDWKFNAMQENVRRSIRALQASKVLSGLMPGGLKIVGAYHELESGKVTLL